MEEKHSSSALERPGVLKPELINMNDLTNERTNERTSERATRRVDRVKNGEKGNRAELTSTEREKERERERTI